MKPETRERLGHALEACRTIERFLSGKTREEYLANALLRSAVERQFEITGEALNRAAQLDASLEQNLPDLRRIVGLRNRIIHGYDAVDDELMWSVAQNNLPALKAVLTLSLE